MSGIHSRRATLALAFAAVGAAPSALLAQSAQPFSIQASALSVSTLGDAYDGMNLGPGLELQLRYTPSAWSFGAGVQMSRHSHDMSDLGDEPVSLAGAFFEPRRVFDVGRSFAPYASARLAYLKQSVTVDFDDVTVDASASGTQLNVGGGVLFRASPRVNVDLGATFGAISFGDVMVNVPGVGSVNAGSSGSGQNVVVRLGLAVGL